MDFSGKGRCLCGKEMSGGGGEFSPKTSTSFRFCECGINALFYNFEEGYELEARAKKKDDHEIQEKEKEKLLSIFKLADLEIIKYWNIKNGYYGDRADWLLVKTPLGLIEIGWRKRVISINWEDTKISHIVKDDVTKGEYFAHAWSYLDAVKYITGLKEKGDGPLN